MFEQENVDSRQVAMVGVFGAVLVFVAIIAIQVLFFRLEKADENVKGRGKPKDVAAFETVQHEGLSTYRWVDKEAKVAAIPIDRAMELTLRELTGASQ